MARREARARCARGRPPRASLASPTRRPRFARDPWAALRHASSSTGEGGPGRRKRRLRRCSGRCRAGSDRAGAFARAPPPFVRRRRARARHATGRSRRRERRRGSARRPRARQERPQPPAVPAADGGGFDPAAREALLDEGGERDGDERATILRDPLRRDRDGERARPSPSRTTRSAEEPRWGRYGRRGPGLAEGDPCAAASPGTGRPTGGTGPWPTSHPASGGNACGDPSDPRIVSMSHDSAGWV